MNAPTVVRPSLPARPDRFHVAPAQKRRAAKKPAGTPAPARKPAKHPAPPPSKPSPASDWVIGPYGDLMSRAEYEALIKSRADA